MRANNASELKLMSKMNLEWIAFTVALNLAGCASIRVGQQVQSGRNALRPSTTVKLP